MPRVCVCGFAKPDRRLGWERVGRWVWARQRVDSERAVVVEARRRGCGWAWNWGRSVRRSGRRRVRASIVAGRGVVGTMLNVRFRLGYMGVSCRRAMRGAMVYVGWRWSWKKLGPVENDAKIGLSRT